MSDVFAEAMAALADSELGQDALFRFRGQEVDIPLRLIPAAEDGMASGMSATATRMLIPATAILNGIPARDDTVVIGLRGWKVEQVARGVRGWAWELTLSARAG